MGVVLMMLENSKKMIESYEKMATKVVTPTPVIIEEKSVNRVDDSEVNLTKATNDISNNELQSMFKELVSLEVQNTTPDSEIEIVNEVIPNGEPETGEISITYVKDKDKDNKIFLIDPITFSDTKVDEQGNEISHLPQTAQPVETIVGNVEPAVSKPPLFYNEEIRVKYGIYITNIESMLSTLNLSAQFIEDSEGLIIVNVYNNIGYLPSSSFGIDINGIIINSTKKIILSVPSMGVEDAVMIPIDNLELLSKYVTDSLQIEEAIEAESKIIQPISRLDVLIDIRSIPMGKSVNKVFMDNLYKLVPVIKEQLNVDHKTRYKIDEYIDENNFTLVSDSSVESVRLYRDKTVGKIYQSMKISPDSDGMLSVSYKCRK